MLSSGFPHLHYLLLLPPAHVKNISERAFRRAGSLLICYRQATLSHTPHCVKNREREANDFRPWGSTEWLKCEGIMSCAASYQECDTKRLVNIRWQKRSRRFEEFT